MLQCLNVQRGARSLKELILHITYHWLSDQSIFLSWTDEESFDIAAYSIVRDARSLRALIVAAIVHGTRHEVETRSVNSKRYIRTTATTVCSILWLRSAQSVFVINCVFPRLKWLEKKLEILNKKLYRKHFFLGPWKFFTRICSFSEYLTILTLYYCSRIQFLHSSKRFL